jgi:hypothetical protein
MTTVFGRWLDGALRHIYTPPSDPARRQKWFAGFAAEKVMPLLTQTVKSIELHGGKATCRLNENDGRLSAELVVIPRHLPAGARPPQLTISAAEGPRPLAIDHTGTFPRSGATGGFGAEIEYDTIHSSQLEEHVRTFVALAI